MMRWIQDLHFILQVKLDKCYYGHKDTRNDVHFAEIHFLLKGGKFTLHAFADCCGNSWICFDDMVSMVQTKVQAMGDVVRTKLTPNSEKTREGLKIRTIEQVDSGKMILLGRRRYKIEMTW